MSLGSKRANSPPAPPALCPELSAFRCAIDEVLQDFDERQISDGLVVLGTMPDQNRHAIRISRGCNLVRQASLADAGLAGNQKRRPRREAASSRPLSIAASSRSRPTIVPGGRIEIAPLYLSSVANLCDESIALGRHGSHESRRLGIVAQSPPELSHRRVDAGLAIDEHALAPDALENLSRVTTCPRRSTNKHRSSSGMRWRGTTTSPRRSS